MSRTMNKFKVLLHMLKYQSKNRGAKDYGQWDSYWSSVHDTGSEGEVLWDTSDEGEMRQAFADFSPHFDASLPVLDLGCGNGRRARFLAQHYDQVIAVDVSPTAIELAKRESEEFSNIFYLVGNALEERLIERLRRTHPSFNIYMRGLYHVIRPKDRQKFSEHLSQLLGDRGTLYQLESDGAFFEYMLEKPDQTETGLPRRMQQVLEHGLRPYGFGPKDEKRWYGESGWNVVASGPSTIRMIDFADGTQGEAPAHFVIARSRGATTDS